MFNCPNCGAPITSDQCEYCGALFELKTTRKADFYTQNELYLQLKIEGLKTKFADQQTQACIAAQQAKILSAIRPYNNYIFGGYTPPDTSKGPSDKVGNYACLSAVESEEK